MVRGMYYCKARRRWRVRLYDGHQHVVHLSYHRTRDQALSTWLQAVAQRQVDKTRTKRAPATPTTTIGLLAALREDSR